MRHRGQGALEYLFMLAAVLILVTMAIRVIMSSVHDLNSAVSNYTKEVRKQILEDL
ncbi:MULTISPECIES: class III signal peptide-containing protein [Thermococcus]|uniref:Class III signal peptide-containing protein n=1 Tax=Thermococcus aciditolerans TaxID=2598455 RepID=A0A5C0SMI2_9EURY|nr:MULTISPECIES: class III signal peptide-containing protein [Thermococcus]QEK15625.1 class III signal peptide-containing protein [Thermococcus aciditolerans]